MGQNARMYNIVLKEYVSEPGYIFDHNSLIPT